MSTRPALALVALTLAAACSAPTVTRKCGARPCASTQRCDLETQLCVQDSPPTVLLDPVPGVASGPTQRLTGRATDDVGVERVEVSGDDGMSWAPAALSGETFSVVLELPAVDLRALAVKARAFDSLGQAGEVTDSFRVDDVGPVVSLRSPRQPVRGPQVALELDATDAAGVQAVSADFGDGQPLDATLDGAVWTVSGPVPALDGAPLSVAVRATDTLGNASAGRVSVAVDAAGPRGTFTTPAPGALVSGTALRVSGEVADGTGVASVRVRLDGAGEAEATVTGAGWAATLALPEANGAPHELVATFTDVLGNSAQARLALTVDNVAPQPALVDPAPDAVVGAAQLAVRLVAVGGASAVTVALGAQPAVSATALGGDVWQAAVSVPAEDFTPETLSVVAVDLAGNRGLAARGVRVDRVAPVLTAGAPGAGQKLNAAAFAGTDAVTVSFGASDGDPQLTLEGFDGSGWRPGSSFAVTTSPADDPRAYPVRARATDRAGNVATLDWAFSVDRVAPRASLSPADGTRNLEPRQAAVTFTEPVYGPTTQTEPLALSPAAPMPGRWSPDHAAFTTAALAPYTVYQAALAAGLADGFGNPVVGAAPTRFHTAAAVPASGAVLATGVRAFEASSSQDGALLVALERGTSADAWSAFAWDPVTGAWGASDYVPPGEAAAVDFRVLASRSVQPDLSAVAVNAVSYANLAGRFTEYSIGGAAQHAFAIAVVPTPPMPSAGLDGTGAVGFIYRQAYTRAPSVTVALGSVPWALAPGSRRWTAWGIDSAQTLTLEDYGCGYAPGPDTWSCGRVSRSLPGTSWDAHAVVSPTGLCQAASTASAGGRQLSTSTWSCLRGGCGASPLTTRAAPGEGLRLAPFAGAGEDALLGAWQVPGGVQLGKLSSASCDGSFVPLGPPLAGAFSRFRPVQLGNKPALLYIDGAGNLKVYAP